MKSMIYSNNTKPFVELKLKQKILKFKFHKEDH